ncbi:unnamed protein product [Amaranthus hypochondriacus]
MEEEEDPVPMNSRSRAGCEWVSKHESAIEMWEPIMPRPILDDSEGEVGLNEPPEMLSNNIGPNIGGRLKEKDRVEDFMFEFSSDSRDE